MEKKASKELHLNEKGHEKEEKGEGGNGQTGNHVCPVGVVGRASGVRGPVQLGSSLCIGERPGARPRQEEEEEDEDDRRRRERDQKVELLKLAALKLSERGVL